MFGQAFNFGVMGSAPTEADFLLVAGGGSGGARDQGPGGAGGLRTSYGSTSGGGASAESKLLLQSGKTYTFTVGAGANRRTEVTSPQAGIKGSDSTITATSFTTITSIGGGAGTGGTGG